MSNVLEVKNIEKYYGNKSNLTKAIDGISFNIEEGEFVGIMGASGSGKTTLLNCISTIDRVTAGKIIINNQDITKLKGNKLNKFRREELGFIFQDFNLLDTLTAYENIALALTIQKVNPHEIDKRVKEVAEKLDITGILNKYPYQISGGQKQRVASSILLGYAYYLVTGGVHELQTGSESIIKISDYNKIAELYGEEQYTLNDDEYIVLCNYDQMTDIRNQKLRANSNIEINGNTYHSQYNECKDGFVFMATTEINAGIILVPDNFEFKNEWTEQYLLVANYNAETEEGKQEIENTLIGSGDTEFFENIQEKGINLDGSSKISITESSKGLSTIIIFIAIYLGIVFLIASAAILALKQLTESSDNKQRYTILRKIGCDEKMINQALFRQIFIFFMMPLILAMMHSIFGIKFILSMLEVLASPDELLPSIIVTALIIGAIYGVYFLATYLGSKNIIKEEE